MGTEEKSELEAESIELRSRAETLNDDLQRARSESRIKVNDYKRQASLAGENTADIFQRQLAEKETELETLNVRYANLAHELQISRNRQTEEVEDLTAKSEKAISQAEFYKTENIRLHDEVKQLTEAAIAEGGSDA